jgi:hypothetical protein
MCRLGVAVVLGFGLSDRCASRLGNDNPFTKSHFVGIEENMFPSPEAFGSLQNVLSPGNRLLPTVEVAENTGASVDDTGKPRGCGCTSSREQDAWPSKTMVAKPD